MLYIKIFDVIAIFILQYLFQIARTVGTLHNVRGDMKETLFYTFIIQTLWLFSTYLGITSIMKGNWWAVASYMVAGILGSWHGIKIVQKKNK